MNSTLLRQTKLRDQIRRIRTTKSEPTVAAVAPQAAPSTGSPRPAVRAPTMMDRMRDDPQLLNYYIQNQKAGLQQVYGPLFQKLQLPPAVQAQFKEILTAETIRNVDLGAAINAKALEWSDPVIRKLTAESEQQTQKEIAALLGEQGFKIYRETERTYAVRGFVDGLAVRVASTSPLNADQADQLTQVIAATTPSYRNGERANPEEVDWPAIDRAAQSILTPDQFIVWKSGTAHNPFAGTRFDSEVTRAYAAAKAKDLAAAAAGN